jgi:outer membrane biogenesis lipoprotein LolB
MTKFFLLILISVFLGACALTTERPKLEMTLAASAFLAAKQADAQVKSPQDFRKAEFYYLKAKAMYKRKYFAKAKELAQLSKIHSERAEYTAIRKKALEQIK